MPELIPSVQASARAHLTLLRFGACDHTRSPLSPAEREGLLRLERVRLVADEQAYSRHPRTLANYQRMHTLFTDFLCLMFDSPDQGWEECRPDHVCLFLHEHLLPQLIGRDGDNVASTTLQGYVSALGQCFRQRGRSRDWCDEAGNGNPIRSSLVCGALRVYQQQQMHAGQRTRSAVPVQPADLTALVLRMDSALVAAARRHQVRKAGLLLRDLTHMLVMWCGGRRGQDVLRFDWEDLYLRPGNGHAVPVAMVWAAEIPHAAPLEGSLLVTPLRTKTERTERPATQEIPVNPDPALCAIRRLRTLYQWQRKLEGGSPKGPVFLSTARRPTRLTAQAAGNRIPINFRLYHAHRGETMHSFRRGHIQAAQAEHEPADVIMQRVGIVTGTTLVKYGDRGRHL